MISRRNRRYRMSDEWMASIQWILFMGMIFYFLKEPQDSDRTKETRVERSEERKNFPLSARDPW